MAAGRGRCADIGRQRDQRPGEDVRDDQIIGRAVADRGMIGPRRDCEREPPPAAAQRHAVDRGIVARDEDARGIDVRRDRPGARPEVHRRKSEQAGSGADVGDIARARALPRKPVEHRQAARRGIVAAGSESLARVDQKGHAARRHAVGIAAGMDEEAPRLNRFESLLRQRDPILLDQLLDLRFLAPGARNQRLQQLQQRRAGLLVQIGVELPQPHILVDLARHDDGRLGQRIELGNLARQGFGLVARAGERNDPAHLGGVLSDASRSASRILAPAA